MQQSTVPRCAILSVASTGVTSSETARVHNATRRRGRSGPRLNMAADDRPTGRVTTSPAPAGLLHARFVLACGLRAEIYHMLGSFRWLALSPPTLMTPTTLSIRSRQR